MIKTFSVVAFTLKISTSDKMICFPLYLHLRVALWMDVGVV